MLCVTARQMLSWMSPVVGAAIAWCMRGRWKCDVGFYFLPSRVTRQDAAIATPLVCARLNPGTILKLRVVQLYEGPTCNIEKIANITDAGYISPYTDLPCLDLGSIYI